MELCAEASILTRAFDAVEDAVSTFTRYWAMSAQIEVTMMKEPTELSRDRNKKFIKEYGQDGRNVASSGSGLSGVAYPLQGGFAAAAQLQRSSQAGTMRTAALNLEPTNFARTSKAAVEAREEFIMVPLRAREGTTAQRKKGLVPVSKAAMAMQRFSPPSRVTEVQRSTSEGQPSSSTEVTQTYSAQPVDSPYDPSDPRDVDGWLPTSF